MDNAMNNFIITGMPRSGTSLLSELVSQLENVYCTDEIFYNLASLQYDLDATRYKLINRLMIMNKFKMNHGKRGIPYQPIHCVEDGEYDQRAKIGSKVCCPYWTNIAYFIDQFKIIYVVRDPVYTIAAWNDLEMERQMHLMPGDIHPIYNSVPLSGKSLLERQLSLWKWHVELMANVPNALKIQYENLLEDPKKEINRVAKFLGVKRIKDVSDLGIELFNGNNESRYPQKIGSMIQDLKKMVATDANV